MVMAGFAAESTLKINWMVQSSAPKDILQTIIAASAKQDVHQIAVPAIAAACNAPTFVVASHVEIVTKTCTAVMSITRRMSLRKQKVMNRTSYGINRLIEYNDCSSIEPSDLS